jgi:hypothetical protein
VLDEQNDEWVESHRYMGLEILAACQKVGIKVETNDVNMTLGTLTA